MPKTTTKAIRYHDFCAGHRVVGHENKCAHLHGHNYRVTFHCEAAELDGIGRVIDFSVIKELLCEWLEEKWDHKFLAWEKDPLITNLIVSDPEVKLLCEPLDSDHPDSITFDDSIVLVPFNPTAENMAKYLVEDIGPFRLKGTGVVLRGVEISETRKCSASYFIED